MNLIGQPIGQPIGQWPLVGSQAGAVDVLLTHSPAVNEIAAALARAQLKVMGAAKSGNNSHLNSTYSKLADIWDACHEAVNAEGIAIVQSPTFIVRDIAGKPTGIARCVTILAHSSGQWLRGEHELICGAIGAQAGGSGITYIRRYALAAMTGVAPNDDIDDDGTVADKQNERQQAQAEGKTLLPATRIAELNEQINGCKTEDDLAKLWLSLSGEEQTVCAKLKDAMKKKLAPAKPKTEKK